MKAAYYHTQGRARDVLTVGEVAEPVPAAGEVRVRIFVSGLNPSDIKARTGFSAAMAYPRIIPHQDGAGVIDCVGEGVSAQRIGQRVWVYEAQQGSPNGTAAESVVVPAHKAVELPADAGMAVGACLGIAALTAHRCLLADGSIRGKRVLVHGAAGADLVIDRHRQRTADVLMAATGAQGVERIVDVDLSANLATNLACSARGAVVSAYALRQATDAVSVPMLEVMKKGIVLRFVYIYSVPQADKLLAIRDITQCLSAGAYAPEIGRIFSLDRIVAAHEAMESSSVIGKILIEVRGEG